MKDVKFYRCNHCGNIIEKVLSHMNFDFAGIDLIYHNGHPVLNEIEDVVGSRMLYNYTDINAGKEYIRYIKMDVKT